MEGEEIFVSRGLLSKSFQSHADLECFLKSASDTMTKGDLVQTIETLYRGYGPLDKLLAEEYGLRVYENKLQFESERRKGISREEREAVGPRRASQVNPVVPLDDKAFLDFLEEQRS